MSNYFLNNIPSTQKREAKYRSNISSKDLNDQQSELLHDVLDLFNKSNKLEKDITELSMLSMINSSLYNQVILGLKGEINSLKDNVQNSNNDPDAMKTMTCYAADAQVENSKYDAIVSVETSDITAKMISSLSKVRVYSEAFDEALVPSSVKVMIGPDSFANNPHVLSIEDNNVNKAFDGDNRTAWLRRVITDESVEEIENEIVVGLPEDIITTRMINQIIIKPVVVADIVDVQTKVNGAWVTVPGFLNHSEIQEVKKINVFDDFDYEDVIVNTMGIKLNFPDIYTNQVKIKLRQRCHTSDKENNRRIWYLGLTGFDINYNRYSKSQSVFSMVYDFSKEPSGKDIKIYDSKVFLNNEEYDEQKGSKFNISKEYYYFDDDDNAHKIPSTCPFVLTGKKLMVKYIMEANIDTPNVYKCQISYKIS